MTDDQKVINVNNDVRTVVKLSLGEGVGVEITSMKELDYILQKIIEIADRLGKETLHDRSVM